MPFKFSLDPIRRTAAFLILFSAVALFTHLTSATLLHLCATLGFALVLYIIFSWFSTQHKSIWDTVITGLILFLLLHYGNSLSDLIFPLTATAIAMILKFFVEFRGSPIINPVVGGLLGSAVVLAFFPTFEHPFVSWWGASYNGYLSLALMAIWIFFGLYQWKKWHIVGSFLAVHAVLLLLKERSLDGLIFTFTDSTIYFFATIMLVEPKTSPFRPNEQLIYGGLTAVFYNGMLLAGVPYFALFALAGANIARVVMANLPKRAKPLSAPSH